LRTINLELPEIYTGPVTNLAPVNRPDDLAYVIYTSGSTGKPKGVMIEHRPVINRLHWMQSVYPIDSRDVLLQKTSVCFDVSVWELFWWALEGATLCLLQPLGEKIPQVLIETVRKHKVSVLHFVPSMLNVFIEYLDGKPDKVPSALSSLRHVFASGEALVPAHVRKFNEIIGQNTGCRLTNLYGPTEATVDVTFFDCPAQGDLDRVPIGRPIQNIRAYIIKDGREMPVGETGELCLAGVGLARGYLNNPELTRERFVEHPARPGERIYRTGDVARWLPDGNLEYLGREDDQIKIRGLRIELGEIENTIRVFPGIADCVVTAKKYSESITLIAAYLVCKLDVDLEALKRHLRRYLPEYMVPVHFENLSRLPLSPNGKVDKKALPQPAIRAKTPRTNG
jgi:surfactin family lipopeptide synthetase A